MSVMKMRINRRPKGFVQVDNHVVRDNRISLCARGALAYLLSQPDTFTLDVRRWAAENTRGVPAYTETKSDIREGRTAIYRALDELKAAGYLKRERVRLANGQFGWEMVLNEFPETGLVPAQDEVEEAPDDPLTTSRPPGYGATRENDTKAQVAPLPGHPDTVNLASIEDCSKKNEHCALDEWLTAAGVHQGHLKIVGRWLANLPSKQSIRKEAIQLWQEMTLLLDASWLDGVIGDVLAQNTKMSSAKYVYAVAKRRAQDEAGIWEWDHEVRRALERKQRAESQAERFNSAWNAASAMGAG